MPEGDNQQQQQNNNQQQQQQQAPWHAGVEPETLGFWQNKGYPLDDAKGLALKLTEQYRAAEKHIGAPPDQIIRLPKDATDAAGWDGVYQRLNVPKEAKDYDLSNVKMAGKDLDPALADALRNGMHKGRVPKDAAPEVAKTVLKALEDAETQRTTVATAKLAEEKATLAKNWGGQDSAKYKYNHLQAIDGARKLGISEEGVAAMENQIGYAGVMEAMRRIGAGTSEDAWVEGNRGPGGTPTTREGAMSRKQELMADPDWGKRYTSGGAKEKQEMDALNIMIDGQAA